jgi:hypothetical protein
MLAGGKALTYTDPREGKYIARYVDTTCAENPNQRAGTRLGCQRLTWAVSY